MLELQSLENELNRARWAQADAEFSRELAREIVSKIANAVQMLPAESLQILDAYVTKSLELVGVMPCE